MKGPTSPTDRAKNHRFARPPPTPPRSAAAGRLIQSPPPKKRHPRLQKTSGAASGESGIRTHGDISTTLDFESSALDQLSHLSIASERTQRHCAHKRALCQALSWSNMQHLDFPRRAPPRPGREKQGACPQPISERLSTQRLEIATPRAPRGSRRTDAALPRPRPRQPPQSEGARATLRAYPPLRTPSSAPSSSPLSSPPLITAGLPRRAPPPRNSGAFFAIFSVFFIFSERLCKTAAYY